MPNNSMDGARSSCIFCRDAFALKKIGWMFSGGSTYSLVEINAEITVVKIVARIRNQVGFVQYNKAKTVPSNRE